MFPNLVLVGHPARQASTLWHGAIISSHLPYYVRNLPPCRVPTRRYTLPFGQIRMGIAISPPSKDHATRRVVEVCSLRWALLEEEDVGLSYRPLRARRLLTP